MSDNKEATPSLLTDGNDDITTEDLVKLLQDPKERRDAINALSSKFLEKYEEYKPYWPENSQLTTLSNDAVDKDTFANSIITSENKANPKGIEATPDITNRLTELVEQFSEDQQALGNIENPTERAAKHYLLDHELFQKAEEITNGGKAKEAKVTKSEQAEQKPKRDTRRVKGRGASNTLNTPEGDAFLPPEEIIKRARELADQNNRPWDGPYVPQTEPLRENTPMPPEESKKMADVVELGTKLKQGGVSKILDLGNGAFALGHTGQSKSKGPGKGQVGRS